ncbi:MAG: WbqC family protein [Candidatus Methylomirabilales bacterium]
MKVAIHQPQYLPWLGYFDKMDQVDCFVVLDDVQFKKNEWQNRNRIKTASGWQYLTVPVLHRFPQRIFEVRINNAVPWPRKHLQALISNYASAPFFDVHRPFFEEVYTRSWKLLLDLNLTILNYLAEALGIRAKLVLASSLRAGINPAPTEKLPGGRTDHLIAICQALGAESYLSGVGGKDYLDLGRFEEAGIQVLFQAFQCPRYPQRFGPFEPNLSVVDLLFNCGSDSLQILRQGRMGGEHPGHRGASG